MPYCAQSSVVAPLRRKPVVGISAALILLAALSACGQRGPLVLPGAKPPASAPSAPAAAQPVYPTASAPR